MRLQHMTFQNLLSIAIVSVITLVFLVFSLLVLNMTEEKIRENVQDNMSMVLGQYETYIENYTNSAYNALKTLESNNSVVQLQISDKSGRDLKYNAASYVQVRRLFDQLYAANSTILSTIYMNFDDGKAVTQAYSQDLLKITYSFDAWKERFPENKYYWIDADICRELIPDPSVGAVLFHLYGTEESEHNGILLLALKKDFFEDLLDVAVLNDDAGISIITQGSAMNFGAANAQAYVEAHRDQLHDQIYRGGISTLWDGYYVLGTHMNLTEWGLVYLVEEDSISNAHYIVWEILLLTLYAIVVVGILIALISRAVSKPLRILTKKVQSKNVLEQEFSVNSYSEITALGNGLEKMRQRIRELLSQVELEQEERRQIEIALMQEQINPHFLYNTLNAIMQLCEMNQPETASRMIEALSTFYRIGLSSGNYLITIEEELEHVKNYLLIQHFRYPDLFDYTIDCEPELLKCRIPKMSLQPLVENAIYHGIRMMHESGNICIIGGSYDGQNAYLEVHDDGPGIAPEKLEEIRRSLKYATKEVRFGMKNVDSRIKFEFGQEMGLEIYSEPRDTCVRIRFRMEPLAGQE